MYRWDFVGDHVRADYESLPTDAGFAFLDLMNAVVLVPFNFVPEPDGHRASSGRVPFAGGLGLAVVQVFPPDEMVTVWQLTWFG